MKRERRMWLRTAREGIMTTLALGWATSIAIAQPTVQIDNEAVCADCVIRVERLFQVGGVDGPGSHVVSPWSHVAMDERGRLLVAGAQIPEIAVFDSNGDFLTTIGGVGRGPGEFQSITTIAAGHGQIHVFDGRRGRVVLDENFTEVGAHPIPGPITSALPMPSGEVLVGADIRTAAAVGHPLHLLTADGGFTSLGEASRYVRGQEGVLVLGSDGKGNVWALNERTNVASLWRTTNSMSDLSIVQRFERHSDWFESGILRPDTWPFSIVESVRVDSAGVWVAGNAPDPDFTPLVGVQPVPDTPFDQVFDGWIEVFDPASGRVLVRRRLDQMVIGFVGPEGLLATYRESQEGAPFLTIWRVKVE